MTRALPLVAVLSACAVTPGEDAGVDAGYTPTQSRLLGLNDLTALLPLEPLDAGTTFPTAFELLPFASFDRLTSASPRVVTDLKRLRVLGVRFDICDRALPGPCPVDADGVFRLVLQPVFGEPPRAEDITLHAFYAVPRADVPGVVDELRALATLQDVPRSAALQVNTSAAYRDGLGALVARYAKAERMHRLTLFGQETDRAANVWIFRGEERAGTTALGPVQIPGINTTSQEVLLFGGDSYTLTPVADAPIGFSRAVMDLNFRYASAAEQLESVRSLLAVDNPNLHTANTVQCASCHVATTLLTPRATDAGVDVTALPERYTSATFDLTPLGDPGTRFRTLRALGYFNSAPLVSQRVVNETAHALEELEARYPAAP